MQEVNRLLTNLDTSSLVDIKMAKEVLSRHNSQEAKEYHAFLCAKEISTTAIVMMYTHTHAKDLENTIKDIDEIITSINNENLNKIIVTDRAKLLERLEYTNSTDYKKKQELALKYQKQQSTSIVVRFAKNAGGLIIFSIVAWFLLSLFIDAWAVIITSVIFGLGAIGMISEWREASTHGKLAYHELQLEKDINKNWKFQKTDSPANADFYETEKLLYKVSELYWEIESPEVKQIADTICKITAEVYRKVYNNHEYAFMARDVWKRFLPDTIGCLEKSRQLEGSRISSAHTQTEIQERITALVNLQKKFSDKLESMQLRSLNDSKVDIKISESNI